MVYENGKETVYKMQFFLVGQRIQGQSTYRTINKMLRKIQDNKPSVSTKNKDHIERIVAEVKFMSTTSKDQSAKTVAEARPVVTTR